MISRERVMTALALKEPDCVPFVERTFANRKIYGPWSKPETNTANIP